MANFIVMSIQRITNCDQRETTQRLYCVPPIFIISLTSVRLLITFKLTHELRKLERHLYANHPGYDKAFGFQPHRNGEPRKGLKENVMNFGLQKKLSDGKWIKLEAVRPIRWLIQAIDAGLLISMVRVGEWDVILHTWHVKQEGIWLQVVEHSISSGKSLVYVFHKWTPGSNGS